MQKTLGMSKMNPFPAIHLRLFHGDIGDCLILKDTAEKEREKPHSHHMSHQRQENFATLGQRSCLLL